MSIEYYQKKRKASNKARERYPNLSEEKKSKKCQYTRERYQNFLKKKKQKARILSEKP